MKKVPCNARSALGQACKKTLKTHAVAKSIYPDLLPEELRLFRQSWGMHKSFEFVNETREKETSKRDANIDAGIWLTEISIAARLGSATHEKTLKMAANYTKHAREYPQLVSLSTFWKKRFICLWRNLHNQ